VLEATACGVGAGVGSSRADQDEEQEYCAVNSGEAPFPFSNFKLILGREFSKGFGIHRNLSLKENEPINSYKVVAGGVCEVPHTAWRPVLLFAAIGLFLRVITRPSPLTSDRVKR